MKKIVYKSLGLILIFFSCIFINKEIDYNTLWIYNQNVFIKKSSELKTDNKDYIGILKIPKINLQTKFYDKNSKNNNVNKNIEILKESSYPDEECSNLIIAGHSGTSKIAFFKNLYKLKTNDDAYIYFKSKKYHYILKKIFYETKDGTITLHKENNISNLTLTTCNNFDNDLQDVYIFNLIDIE